jgi:hypothetical protein
VVDKVVVFDYILVVVVVAVDMVVVFDYILEVVVDMV